MKAYIFFSVYEEVFHRVALRLREYGVDQFAGFVWGAQQAAAISNGGIDYDLVTFTRDLLPRIDDGAEPDLEWLARRERELGVSIQRMLASERHLLATRDWKQIMRLAEVGLREIAAALDRIKPDFLYSEDISCFHSYAHFVLARERGIPFWVIGRSRMPKQLAIYSVGFQHVESTEHLYAAIRARGLTANEREAAQRYVQDFRDKPTRPTGMESRAKRVGFEKFDLRRLRQSSLRYFGDRRDPTVRSPAHVVSQRLTRIVRQRMSERGDFFEKPVEGERYVLYPIHFQPEASTLVQAPMYLDQVALLDDIAKSLPIGVRLYVKEHVSNRGRRELSFYEAIRKIKAVRLLGPDTNNWTLIRGAAAVTVITGTTGWEGLLFDKPVVTFGDVFFNLLPQVHRAGSVPKDEWFGVFDRAIHHHVPDPEAVLAMVSAIQQTSYPGLIHNPESYPHVLDGDNIDEITRALATEAKLARR